MNFWEFLSWLVGIFSDSRLPTAACLLRHMEALSCPPKLASTMQAHGTLCIIKLPYHRWSLQEMSTSFVIYGPFEAFLKPFDIVRLDSMCSSLGNLTPPPLAP